MLSLAQSFLPFCACSTLVKGSDDSWYGNALYGLNLAPRVLGLFGQRVSSRKDSGVLDAIFSENEEFTWHCYLGDKSITSFHYPRSSPSTHLPLKKPVNSGCEIVMVLKQRKMTKRDFAPCAFLETSSLLSSSAKTLATVAREYVFDGVANYAWNYRMMDQN